MDIQYYDVTAELDAREILRYLNHLGIQNISAEVLKYFITDLKKLIKYDLQQKNKMCSSEKLEPSGPERLHSASTFSSRIRSKCQSNTPVACSRECRQSISSRNVRSAPSLGQTRSRNADVNTIRRACSCVRVEKKEQEQVILKDRGSSSTSNNNLIKVPKQPAKKKCDPVSLYHYYTSLWAKYKPNVPGENDWSDLRWSIRQKMAGSSSHTNNLHS